MDELNLVEDAGNVTDVPRPMWQRWFAGLALILSILIFPFLAIPAIVLSLLPFREYPRLIGSMIALAVVMLVMGEARYWLAQLGDPMSRSLLTDWLAALMAWALGAIVVGMSFRFCRMALGRRY